MSRFQRLQKVPYLKYLYNKVNPVTGKILMLHRVTEKRSSIKENRLLEITPSFLEKTILEYQALNYRFVSIDEAYNIQYQRTNCRQPYVCFTFDDGFRDNLTEAFPLFKKYNIPFTIFVATAFPEGKACIWWYELDELLQQVSEIKFADGVCHSCETQEKKNQVFKLIGEIIKNTPKKDVRSFLNQILVQNELNVLSVSSKAVALSWDDIRELHESGLCSIGSHGVSHAPLTKLPNDDLMYELQSSKSLIEEKLGTSVLHLAYPFGDYDAKVVNAAKLCGYKSAVRVGGGMQRLNQNPFHFKREGLIEKP